MKIKVIGKAHFEGTSKKSGNPYSFNQVHYTGKARGVVGEAALTVTLDPDIYPYDKIEVGQSYNLECDTKGYVVEFAPTKPF